MQGRPGERTRERARPRVAMPLVATRAVSRAASVQAWVRARAAGLAPQLCGAAQRAAGPGRGAPGDPARASLTPPGPSTKACLQAAQGGAATSGSVAWPAADAWPHGQPRRAVALRSARRGRGVSMRSLEGARRAPAFGAGGGRWRAAGASRRARAAGPGSRARNALHVLSGAASTCCSRGCPPPHGIPTLSLPDRWWMSKAHG